MITLGNLGRLEAYLGRLGEYLRGEQDGLKDWEEVQDLEDGEQVQALEDGAQMQALQDGKQVQDLVALVLLGVLDDGA